MHNKLTRRDFCKTAGPGLVGLTAIKKSLAAQDERLLYVGTYTGGKSKSEGIYIYKMSAATGALKLSSVVKGIASPSFLAIDPSRKFLYAVNETPEFNGQKGGGLTAFAIDRKTGNLTKLNQQSSPGVPCHVSVHNSGKFVFAANYGGGNVVMYPVKADGSLEPQSYVAQHTGKGGDPRRQDGPHAHCIMLDPYGTYAFAPDLGIDKVMIYKVDTKSGKLLDHGFAPTRAGAGPRHFDFHPNGKYAYVINELNSTLMAFSYDKSNGKLTELQTLSTLPEGFSGNSNCADVHVHPSGKYVYGSNRGHDSIAIFEIDQTTGKLKSIGHESTRGKTPRNFGLDPAGRFLFVANQNTDNVVSFRLDPKSGTMTPTGEVTTIPTPVCLKFI